MKILLIGDFSGKPDEGLKNMSHHIRIGLSKRHDVLTVNTKEAVNPFHLRIIKRFSPEIVHYLHGPSIKSLIILKLISLLLPNAKTLSSATNPRISNRLLSLVPFLKPSVALTQSKNSDAVFHNLGITTQYFPNGVDIEKFRPVNSFKKAQLRKKYNVDTGEFIVLHVGHIKKNRNIDTLCDVRNCIKDIRIIIVGSKHFKKDKEIEKNLTKSGCLIWREYFKSMNEIYSIADCYIFTVESKKASTTKPALNTLTGCIEIPMSVLEAMACNLPVITTKYGGLPDLFKEGDGLFFYEHRSVIDKIRAVMNGHTVNTRKLVAEYSWDKMIDKLEKIYLS